MGYLFWAAEIVASCRVSATFFGFRQVESGNAASKKGQEDETGPCNHPRNSDFVKPRICFPAAVNSVSTGNPALRVSATLAESGGGVDRLQEAGATRGGGDAAIEHPQSIISTPQIRGDLVREVRIGRREARRRSENNPRPRTSLKLLGRAFAVAKTLNHLGPP